MKILAVSVAVMLSIPVFVATSLSETSNANKKPITEAAVSPMAAPAQIADRVSPDKVAEKSSLIVTRDYIIGPEDTLEITVWRNQDLSRLVQVRPDGRISLPLIGDVTA